jgi:uncharacterized protein YndB with AHSA1/START domain
MSTRISASRVVDASADDVFRAITDLSRLPEWNPAITALVEQPEHLDVGAQWVVEMHALGRTWHSRSAAETIDPVGRVFAYRSVTDDGNPSHALWTWVVTDHEDGALVTVASELHPLTFWRRVLLLRIRCRQLAHTELPHSLAALEAVTKRSPGIVPGTNTGGNQ